MIDFESYRQGLMAGLEIKQGSVCSLFGYSLVHIKEALEFWERSKTTKRAKIYDIDT